MESEITNPYWRKNLAIMWLVQTVTVLSFTFTFPFFPLFFKELGIDDPGRAAFITGISGWALGIGLGIFSPIWGAVADRYGKKINVIRATALAALVLGLSGFAESPNQLIVTRFFAGAFGGAGAAILALVVATTPRYRAAFATGIIQSAMFAGSTIGPVIGGLLFDHYGMRWAFFANGIGLAIPALMVILFVHEDFQKPRNKIKKTELFFKPYFDFASTLTSSRMAPLLFMYFISHAAMLVIFPALPVIIESVYVGPNLASASGIAFMTMGVTQALSAILAGLVSTKFGLKKTIIVLSGISSLLYIPPIFADEFIHMILFLAAIGLFQGGVMGTLNGLFAMSATPGKEGRTFGAQQVVMAASLSAGPLIGGTVAFAISLRAVFAVNVIFYIIVVLSAAFLMRNTYIEQKNN